MVTRERAVLPIPLPLPVPQEIERAQREGLTGRMAVKHRHR